MHYNNLTIVLALLTDYELTLFHEYVQQSRVRGSLREQIADWFTRGGFQRTFEVNHHSAYIHELSKLQRKE